MIWGNRQVPQGGRDSPRRRLIVVPVHSPRALLECPLGKELNPDKQRNTSWAPVVERPKKEGVRNDQAVRLSELTQHEESVLILKHCHLILVCEVLN